MVGLGLIVLVLTGCSTTRAEPTATPIPPTSTPEPPKRALLLIQENFNADEYGEPRALLEENGVIVSVAASSMDVVTAYAQEAEAQPDMLLSQVQVADYDVIVLVGGYPYDPEDSEMQRIAREAVAEGKLVAGICNGVITMGQAGVLEGKRVTSLFYHPVSEFEGTGAILVAADVERDGLIISGNGPGASQEFAEAIVQALGE
jgi:protease I